MEFKEIPREFKSAADKGGGQGGSEGEVDFVTKWREQMTLNDRAKWFMENNYDVPMTVKEKYLRGTMVPELPTLTPAQGEGDVPASVGVESDIIDQVDTVSAGGSDTPVAQEREQPEPVVGESVESKPPAVPSKIRKNPPPRPTKIAKIFRSSATSGGLRRAGEYNYEPEKAFTIPAERSRKLLNRLSAMRDAISKLAFRERRSLRGPKIPPEKPNMSSTPSEKPKPPQS